MHKLKDCKSFNSHYFTSSMQLHLFSYIPGFLLRLCTKTHTTTISNLLYFISSSQAVENHISCLRDVHFFQYHVITAICSDILSATNVVPIQCCCTECGTDVTMSFQIMSKNWFTIYHEGVTTNHRTVQTFFEKFRKLLLFITTKSELCRNQYSRILSALCKQMDYCQCY